MKKKNKEKEIENSSSLSLSLSLSFPRVMHVDLSFFSSFSYNEILTRSQCFPSAIHLLSFIKNKEKK